MKRYLSLYQQVDQHLVISPSAAGVSIGELVHYAGKEFTRYTRPLTLFCMGEKAKNVFMKCEYWVKYPLAIASGVDEIVKDLRAQEAK